jgi:hypothetical protein
MIQETIQLLGKTATDKITGFSGVIGSVCFDISGCVQALLFARRDSPPQEIAAVGTTSKFIDVQRLEISDAPAVMPVPDFDRKSQSQQPPTPATYQQGSVEKPIV